MRKSALAAELRHFAATLRREAERQSDPDACRLLASKLHTQALRLEAGLGRESNDDGRIGGRR